MVTMLKHDSYSRMVSKVGGCIGSQLIESDAR